MISIPIHARRAAAASLIAAAALAPAACRSPDPQAVLAIEGLETYWAVDSPSGENQYIAPVVRFNVRLKAGEPQRSVQATATFRRQGDPDAWSSAWQQVSPLDGKSMHPEERRQVLLKPEGEGRYHTPGSPESMFSHPQFKDVQAEVFLRVGSSSWSKFTTVDVDRRIGAHGAEAAAR